MHNNSNNIIHKKVTKRMPLMQENNYQIHSIRSQQTNQTVITTLN